ncbi:methylosome subunit pICln-like [Uloborus diversus]|uniref:methylosome subunit pICln-like n=1 Tax=Uloborus diversus TaxID=327109 RepID=UPI0024091C4F|nr:methylosome subunit pICln-like [Uloborus diversus]XP_054713020.1 methylosome subunit pICln-like [Uloborus diversus]
MVFLMNFPAPTEGIHHCEPNTRAFHDERCLGKGTLYIAESAVCWISEGGEGFSVPYPSVSIHGVSKDARNFPEECLLVYVDGEISLREEANAEVVSRDLQSLSVDDNSHGDGVHANDGDDDDDDEKEIMTKLRFVPDNKIMLDTLFQALSECQTMSCANEVESEEENTADFPFTISEANGFDIEDGDEDGDEGEYDDMEEDQFEDAEQ